MRTVYAARYKDRNGEELTSIHNDGNTFEMTVRGVEFEGSDFDGFEAKGSLDTARLSSFTFSFHGQLCDCVIQAAIPVQVITPYGIVDSVLDMDLELGKPTPKQGLASRGSQTPIESSGTGLQFQRVVWLV